MTHYLPEIEISIVLEALFSPICALTEINLHNLLLFSVPYQHVPVPLQEREMGGGIFYDTLYRETFTQELHMLTK
jgi:hypothetical protein